MAESIIDNTAVAIQLKGIELLNGTLNLPSDATASQTTYNYNLSIETKTNEELKLIFVIVNVDIRDPDLQQFYGSVSVSCIYEVEHFAQVVTRYDDGRAKIDKPLLDTLGSISISTTRGVMFAMFRGTHLHNAFLPIIDSRSFKQQ